MNDYAKHPDIFTKRHIGPSDDDVALMLNELGFSSMSEFINNVIPDSIAFNSSLKVGDGVGEQEALKILKSYSSKNKIFKILFCCRKFKLKLFIYKNYNKKYSFGEVAQLVRAQDS